MKKLLFLRDKIILFALLLLTFSAEILAQAGTVRVPTPQKPAAPPAAAAAADDTWWYVTLFVLLAGLVGAVIWWQKSKKSDAEKLNTESKKRLNANKNSWDADSVDADKEMEWYRKHQKAVGKKGGDKYPKKFPKTSKVLNKNVNPVEEETTEIVTIEREVLREKMMKLQFSQLPIVSFNEMKPAKDYELLPISNSDDLLSAVEQAQDEFEEDEEVRDLAVRILAAFKTRNSIESLSQIALYDLSSNLRSKAVTILTEFDHESVFETILLACADPTREVRAAAARGLFRLSFDRADAWKRIAETHDEFRMRQAARAAVEADLVKRSFDRLIHDDLKIAYEAFTLTALMIRAGETKQLFETIENHRDNNVKLALLHVLKVVKDESTLSNLYSLLEHDSLSAELKEKVDETIKSFEMVAA